MDASDLFSGADNTSLQPAWEAISASGHKIVSSRIASAPTRQFRPTTVQPRNCALESTIALLALRSGHSSVLTKSGFQFSRKIVRCTSRYSAREEMLNHFPSFITTPPILAPWPIQSPMIGINEIFLRGGIRGKIARVPNRDIGKIKISRDAVAVADVHDTLIAQSHSGRQTGVTQSERHVVSATEMFVDQRLEIDVG